MERIGITIKYAIKRNGLYLQGIEINEKYEKTVTAPTMGNAHVYSEYKTKLLILKWRWKNKKI